jgi:hypothetical protein
MPCLFPDPELRARIERADARVPWRPEEVSGNLRQKRLLTGLDCLEGQGELFGTDGTRDISPQGHK